MTGVGISSGVDWTGLRTQASRAPARKKRGKGRLRVQRPPMTHVASRTHSQPLANRATGHGPLPTH